MVYRLIRRRGGSLRMNFLLRMFPHEKKRELLASAIDELIERFWITALWRPDAPERPPDAPCPIEGIDRLTATRFGKRKARQRLWGQR